jgi:hypothetical protein
VGGKDGARIRKNKFKSANERRMGMYKKQFLKIGKRKLSGGIFAGLMILGVLSGTVMAGNTTDTFYSYEASGGVWGQTEVRAKQDATSVYVFHKGNYPAYFGVYSGSTNYTVGSPFAYAPMGVATYIPNMVKENNLNECYLVIQPANTAPATLYGYWSPDSI